MGNQLLLVGSIPLDTVEEVMRTFGAPLGRYLPAMPDGEVGERRSWVNRFSYLLFNGHPDLETLRRPPKIDGVEQLLPTKRSESWQFRVRPGVARKFVPSFGLAAYCGFGRTPPEQLPQLLEDHLQALELLKVA